uniref:DUF2207 domain-containing protein n=1 Tax=Nosocomiicoccus ampullae TaxID=489910 RepID=UPI00082FA45C|nr:DUF2207 domain-containing protein [Nosocomiicoccus ampullae]
MRYIKGIILVLMLMLVTFNVANANEIQSIDIHLNIKKDGSVEVTETRHQNMDEGTENFIVFKDSDMQGTTVENFSVDGMTLEENWDSEASREEKAGKYGILETNEGFDLVWGIGEYGRETYTVRYTLTNLVHNLDDGQALYWDFNTFTGLPTDKMTMTISTFEPFNEDNVRFYGFGIVGDMNYNGDNIVWESTEAMDKSNYATVLLLFNPNMYSATISDNKTLESLKEQALHNSNYSEDGTTEGPKEPKFSKIFDYVGMLIGLMFVGGFSYFLYILVSTLSNIERVTGISNIKRQLKHVTSDVPPKGIDDYAGFSLIFGNLGYSYFNHLISAYLIEWQRDGRIDIEFEDDGKRIDKRNTVITINDFDNVQKTYGGYFKEAVKKVKDKTFNEDYELLVWLMFVDAVKDDNKITKKQLKRWFRKNKNDVKKVNGYLKEYSKEYLLEHGYMTSTKKKRLFIKTETLKPTEKGRAFIEECVKYHNYLKEEDELEWVNRMKVNEISLEELVYVYLLGLSEETGKRIKKHDFDRSNIRNLNYLHYFYLVNNTSGTVDSALSSGSMSSSGMGGSTGMGGGMGAGGGGGGGAR